MPYIRDLMVFQVLQGPVSQDIFFWKSILNEKLCLLWLNVVCVWSLQTWTCTGVLLHHVQNFQWYLYFVTWNYSKILCFPKSWRELVKQVPRSDAGPCINTAICLYRNPFSQWQCRVQWMLHSLVNSSPLGQNGRHFADDILRRIFNWNFTA